MSILNHRTRGFRTINIVACALLMVTAIVVLLAKAYAGREVREIARTERAIAEQNKRIRLLKAEVAHLEQPERLQRLAKDLLGMGPLAAAREGDISSLDALAAGHTPAPPVATPAAPEIAAQEDVGPAAEPPAPTPDAPLSPAETGQ
jgi:cell division protein FtsL